MEKFITPANGTALSLAFGQAAPAKAKISHPYRYFIAGGATLQKIEECLNDVSRVEQVSAALAQEAGAKSYSAKYGEFKFDFDHKEVAKLAGSEQILGQDGKPHPVDDTFWARVPRLPDFVMTNSRNYGNFYPNIATPLGLSLAQKCQEIAVLTNPLQRFARWLGCESVHPAPDHIGMAGSYKPLSVQLEKIGNDWIVAVPAVVHHQYVERRYGAEPTGYNESWTIPPDSTPLAVSDYFRLLEQNNIIGAPPPAP